MSFNTSKCSVRIFDNTRAVNIQDLQYKLNNTVVQRVNSTKYLGVNITGNFNWSVHIVKKQSEAMQTLGMLKQNLVQRGNNLLKNSLSSDGPLGRLLKYTTACNSITEPPDIALTPLLLTSQLSLLMSTFFARC